MPQAAQEAASVPGRVQPPLKRVVTEDKAAVIAMLRAEGMKTKAIAETLGLSTSTVYQADHQAKRSGINPLLSRKRIKKASTVIDTFMEGKAIGGEIDPETGKVEGGVKPKCSTVLAAANVVLDRAYPKAQEDQGKGNISFTTINIGMAAPANAPTEVDITPPVST